MIRRLSQLHIFSFICLFFFLETQSCLGQDTESVSVESLGNVAIHGRYQEKLKDFSVSKLVSRLLGAVVNISALKTMKESSTQGDVLKPNFKKDDKDFQQYFEDFFHDKEKMFYQKQSLGSGFVVDAKEGLIVTNNHVIGDADIIEVVVADGTKLKAKLLGRDQKTDIALLKVDPKSYPLREVKFSDSDQAKIGDWVLAIGNPYGFGGTVTIGIISARDRTIDLNSFDDFIQTDAAINRGNSGGPLFDMNGGVVGMNSAIISPSGGSVGLGFAIPSQVVQGVISQLKRFGEVRRSRLGLYLQTLTPMIAKNLGLSSLEGAFVAGKISAKDIDNTAICVGDIILAFDNKPVKNARELSRMISAHEVGATVSLKILRDQKEKIVSARVGAQESETEKTSQKNNKGAKKINFLPLYLFKK